MIAMRDYQRTLIADLLAAAGQSRRVLCQLPTGAGKSVIAAEILRRVITGKKTAMITVHRRELVWQFYETVQMLGLQSRTGLLMAGEPAVGGYPIQIGMIQTVARRLGKMRSAPDVHIIDEAHHCRAATWERVCNAFGNSMRIGFTATPRRLDGRPLSTTFDTLVEGPSMQELIADGWLSQYECRGISQRLDLEGVHRAGDKYRSSEVDARLTEKIIANAAAAYVEHARGRKAIFFGITRSHSERVADELRRAGVRAAHVDHETEQCARDASIREFKTGTLEVICNVDLFSEGVDAPACEVVMMGRPTSSLTIYLQQAGRMMRPAPGKTALLIDLCGNVSANATAHGLPCAPRNWSLDGLEPDPPRQKLRECPQCHDVRPAAGRQVCVVCGFVFSRGAPVQVHEVAADLVDLRRPRMQEQEQCYQDYVADEAKRRRRHWYARQKRQ